MSDPIYCKDCHYAWKNYIYMCEHPQRQVDESHARTSYVHCGNEDNACKDFMLKKPGWWARLWGRS